jgi:hypothetical protein
MNAHTWASRVAALVLLSLGAPAARAAEDPLAGSLRQVVVENLAAFNRKDVGATMSFVDTRSPDYGSTKDEIVEDFKSYDLTAELVGFTLIGHDDEFAVARVKTKTSTKPNSGFVNNEVDAIVIFHQENGAWKLWSQQVIDAKTLQ